MARGVFILNHSRGDIGFREDLPAVVVSEAFDLESGVLDAMDHLRRGSGVLHDVKPVTIFELLG
jgi:hypothetical protein